VETVQKKTHPESEAIIYIPSVILGQQVQVGRQPKVARYPTRRRLAKPPYNKLQIPLNRP
jgi:hypothetical protein